jgi:hypothetical protein
MTNDDKDEKGKPSDGDAEYIVGNKKPPKHCQFPPGKSGNPKGRPKGACNFLTWVAKELCSKIKIPGAGGPNTISKERALAKLIVNKALKGDSKALQTLLQLIKAIEIEKAEKKKKEAEEGPAFSWTEAQEKLYRELEAVMGKEDGSEDEGN